MVPGRGVESPRPEGRRILSLRPGFSQLSLSQSFLRLTFKQYAGPAQFDEVS